MILEDVELIPQFLLPFTTKARAIILRIMAFVLPQGRVIKMKQPGGVMSNRPTQSSRPERAPGTRAQWEHNKKIILSTQSICGICGRPVDKSLKYPDPMSPTVDHIIPVSKRGDPVALENLQLAHRYCNRLKSDKLPLQNQEPEPKEKIIFPQSRNWRTE